MVRCEVKSICYPASFWLSFLLQKKNFFCGYFTDQWKSESKKILRNGEKAKPIDGMIGIIKKTLCVKIGPKKAWSKGNAVSVRAFHCRSAQRRHQMSFQTPCICSKPLPTAALVPFSTLCYVASSNLFTTEKIPSYFCILLRINAKRW